MKEGYHMYYINHYASPLGDITMASNGKKLTGLWFDQQKYFADTLSAPYQEKYLPVFEQTKQWLDCYFQGKIPSFMPPLCLEGSPFRMQVWEMLQKIPYGKTVTYGEIAKEISQNKLQKAMSAQAVGGAVGHNPISIVVPCHRVVGKNGNLTGYAGGIEKKIKLLTIEKIDMKQFFVPAKGTAL